MKIVQNLTGPAPLLSSGVIDCSPRENPLTEGFDESV